MFATRRFAGRVVLPVVAAVAAGTGLVIANGDLATASPDAAAGSPPWCVAAGDLDAARLPTRVAPTACRLTNRTIRSRHLSVVAPEPGQEVTASAVLDTGGEESLTVSTSADGTVTVSTEEAAAAGSADTAAKAAAAPAACADPTFTIGAVKWPTGSTYQWFYNPANQTAGGLTAADALAATRAATHNMVTGHNDCGLAARADVFQSYRGTTTAPPDISDARHCTKSDGRNVTGWGDLGSTGVLALTCTWSRNKVAFASDMKANTHYRFWNGSGTCPAHAFDYQSVATHERGHTFGLGHVPSGHQEETMAGSIGPCNSSKRTLAKGDHDGMIALYGAR